MCNAIKNIFRESVRVPLINTSAVLMIQSITKNKRTIEVQILNATDFAIQCFN